MVELSTLDEKPIPDHHVIVKFGAGIPSNLQSKAVFDMEVFLRTSGVAAEVFKETKADDSKLRRNMTKEQRERL